MGVAYNMQPIVGGGSIGGVIYISIHTQTTSECGNICLDGFEVQTSIINHEAKTSFLPYCQVNENLKYSDIEDTEEENKKYEQRTI